MCKSLVTMSPANANGPINVKYSELQDWDPGYTEPSVSTLPAAEEEVRKELDQKATLAKARAKLDALELATDVLNS